MITHGHGDHAHWGMGEYIWVKQAEPILKKRLGSEKSTGHIHPKMRLKGGFDEVRLPSFMLSEKTCLLPAFSHLTGSHDMKLQKGEKAIVIMEDGLEIFSK